MDILGTDCSLHNCCTLSTMTIAPNKPHVDRFFVKYLSGELLKLPSSRPKAVDMSCRSGDIGYDDQN
jgi:hypothetical protein